MEKKKALAKNIGVLTISQFATKFLSFFLIPIYTSILTTEDYGTFDLISNTISILVPVLTLNISEAVVRFVIDEGIDKKNVFNVGVKYIAIGNIIVILGAIFLRFIPIVKRYGVYICAIFFVQSVATFLTFFARGLDKFKEISISSVFASVIVILSNIIFLVILDYGLNGYFIASILGPLVQIFYLFFRMRIWKYIGVEKRNLGEREMLSYSQPLIANSIGWWINSVSDRYVVTLFCGIGENGIYSVASKIPSIMNLLVGIFNQAWTLSSAREFDSKDQDGFFSNLYNMYNTLIVLACAMLITLNKILSAFLYSNNFFDAWKYVPFLLIASAFGGISGYMGGIFSAVKDSKVIGKTTMIGAGVNLAMNIFLVPFCGALGAAIATLFSYWITYCARLIKLREYIQMKIHIVRDNISYLLLTLQGTCWLFNISYKVQIVLTVLQFILYKKEILIILAKIKRIFGVIWNEYVKGNKKINQL